VASRANGMAFASSANRQPPGRPPRVGETPRLSLWGQPPREPGDPSNGPRWSYFSGTRTVVALRPPPVSLARAVRASVPEVPARLGWIVAVHDWPEMRVIVTVQAATPGSVTVTTGVFASGSTVRAVSVNAWPRVAVGTDVETEKASARTPTA